MTTKTDVVVYIGGYVHTASKQLHYKKEHRLGGAVCWIHIAKNVYVRVTNCLLSALTEGFSVTCC